MNPSSGSLAAGALFDSSGGLYVSYVSTSGQGIAEALGANGKRWIYTFNSGCQPFDEALGYGGELYVALMCATGPPRQIVALGAASGALLYDNTVGWIQQIKAYRGGLIVFGTDTLAYFDNSGSTIASFATTSLVNNDQIAAWGSDGSVYFAAWTSTFDPAVTLYKYMPSGLSWSYTWPTAYHQGDNYPSVAALPNGSVAVNIGANGFTGGGVTVLTTQAGAAVPVWSTNIGTNRYGFDGVHQVLGDANGNVAAEFDYLDKRATLNCPSVFNDCVAYEIDLFHGSSGTTVSKGVVHTGAKMTYALGTDFDLDSGTAVLGGAVDAQLTMFGFALNGAAQSYPESDRPVVGPTPSAPSISVAGPSPTDPILTRSLGLTSAPGTTGSPIAKYQYGWAQGSGATLPTTTLQSCKAGSLPTSTCRLSFAPTNPNTQWTLLARAIDSAGKSSAWSSTSIRTPTAPILVALGDSITSGHHTDPITSLVTCNDAAYGYPAYVFAKMEADIPSQWRNPSGYYNFAYSGFTTTKMINGGNDACGANHSSSVIAAQSELASNSSSWNQIVITGGIDDTGNWGGILAKIITGYLKNPLYNAQQCTNAVKGTTAVKGWGGYDPSIQSTIKTNVTTIADDLRTGDASASLYWIGYYNIAGTGYPGLSVLSNPVAPATCANPFQAANAELASVIKSGLTGIPYTWINADKSLHMDDLDLQSISAINMLVKIKSFLPGWPHPNSTGASVIASLFANL